MAASTDGVTDVVHTAATGWCKQAVAVTKGRSRVLLKYPSGGSYALAPSIVGHQLYYSDYS